jgi:GT2 family glycosyltransferase
MKMLAVIVNFCTPSMTVEAVETFLENTRNEFEWRLIVVDNDSRDSSFEQISAAIAERTWSDTVSIVASDRNGGFGYGNNVAIRRALEGGDPPDYFYLLNSDAFAEPGAANALVQFLDSHPDVGIAGSLIHNGDVDASAFRFPSLISELDSGARLGLLSLLCRRWSQNIPISNTACKVGWVSGASMMVRREVFESVGLFDETFFLFFEETDLCLRAARAGWQTWYVPDGSVRHIGGASTGLDFARPIPGWWFASRRHYFLKNHGRIYLWAANVTWVASYATWRLRRIIQRKPDHDPPGMLRDFIRYNFGFWRANKNEIR